MITADWKPYISAITELNVFSLSFLSVHTFPDPTPILCQNHFLNGLIRLHHFHVYSRDSYTCKTLQSSLDLTCISHLFLHSPYILGSSVLFSKTNIYFYIMETSPYSAQRLEWLHAYFLPIKILPTF